MKKVIITTFTILGLFILPVKAIEFPFDSKSFGVSLTNMSLDTTVKDDIDSNGTIDTTKDISNDFVVPSIFLEVNKDLANGGMLTVGLDLIPMTAEMETRTTTQSSNGGSNGTNKGTVDAKNHLTAYVKLGGEVRGTELFVLGGYMYAEGDYDLQSVSSTNRTGTVNIKGTKIGVGLERDIPVGFMRLMLSENSYDTIAATTSNATRVTADMDSTNLTLSIGKNF